MSNSWFTSKPSDHETGSEVRRRIARIPPTAGLRDFGSHRIDDTVQRLLCFGLT